MVVQVQVLQVLPGWQVAQTPQADCRDVKHGSEWPRPGSLWMLEDISWSRNVVWVISMVQVEQVRVEEALSERTNAPDVNNTGTTSYFSEGHIRPAAPNFVYFQRPAPICIATIFSAPASTQTRLTQRRLWIIVSSPPPSPRLPTHLRHSIQVYHVHC